MTLPAHAWADLVAGVILAGGQSRRMGGGDKCLMMLGDTPMLGHAINRLMGQANRLVLNANGDPKRFANFGLPIAADGIDGFAGPLAGVLAGMEWAEEHVSGAKWIVTAASDTPFFPTDLVARCVAAAGHDENTIALAASGGRIHPVFGLWPIALAPDLREWLHKGGSRKVLEWVDRHVMAEVIFDGFSAGGELLDPFFNANTPEDFQVAEAVLEELAA